MQKLLLCCVAIVTTLLSQPLFADESSKAKMLDELGKEWQLADRFEARHQLLVKKRESVRTTLLEQYRRDQPNASDQYWQSYTSHYKTLIETIFDHFSSQEMAVFYLEQFGKNLSDSDVVDILKFAKSAAGHHQTEASKQADVKLSEELYSRVDAHLQDALAKFHDEMEAEGKRCGAIIDDNRSKCKRKDSAGA